MTAVELAGVSRWYGNVVAVNDITMTLGPGVTGLLGPNGAGKTTLLHMMAGFLPPSQGTVTVDGEPSWRNPSIYSKLGLVVEREAAHTFLSGYEFVVASARMQKLPNPADAARRAIALVEMEEAAAPDDVSALVNLTTAPPLPVIPEEWHGKKVAAFLAVSAGPLDAGAGIAAPFRAVAEPIADLLGPMPYQVIQTLLDPLWPKGINAYFKATNLARLDDELIDQLCEIHLAAPGPQCEIHVQQMGGAIARVDERATAFPDRAMLHVLNAVTGWHDAEAGPGHRDWARAVIAAAAGASTGRAYVNFLGDPDAARTSYGEDTYARLVSLKDQYDPTNVFRLNQNIAPTGS